MVDLRDVPLRLPDRSDRRRELLDGWQAAVVRRRWRDERPARSPSSRAAAADRGARSTPCSIWRRATGCWSRPGRRSWSARRSRSGCATDGSRTAASRWTSVPLPGERWQPTVAGRRAGAGRARARPGRRGVPVPVEGPLAHRDRRHRRPDRDAGRRHRPRRAVRDLDHDPGRRSRDPRHRRARRIDRGGGSGSRPDPMAGSARAVSTSAWPGRSWSSTPGSTRRR